jgi:hypothetical protein
MYVSSSKYLSQSGFDNNSHVIYSLPTSDDTHIPILPFSLLPSSHLHSKYFSHTILDKTDEQTPQPNKSSLFPSSEE